ncbi:unnamed protein product [Effrenium voratum]|nr:unnamed protein product [Effrenium voratum]
MLKDASSAARGIDSAWLSRFTQAMLAGFTGRSHQIGDLPVQSQIWGGGVRLEGSSKLGKRKHDEILFAASSGTSWFAPASLSQALKATWDTGNAAELVKALEACNDDSLAAAFLGRLTQHPQLPAVSLARLLPLAQRLVQADCEEHAVAAVRFALHSLQVSWPTIAKSLKSIGTSQVLLAACEEAVGQLQSLYSTVKALSRSVKISKTNGPLVPLCKKLKVSLEQALTGVGRLRA